MQKLGKKMTKPVRRSTQGGDFNINQRSKVQIVLPEIYATKSVTWNFHMNDSQVPHMYGMILGWDIFSELNIDANVVRTYRHTNTKTVT